MHELDGGGERVVTIALVAAELCRRERENGPQALAAGRDDVSGQLRDQRDRALHVIQNQRVDALKVKRHQFLDRAQVTDGCPRARRSIVQTRQ